MEYVKIVEKCVYVPVRDQAHWEELQQEQGLVDGYKRDEAAILYPHLFSEAEVAAAQAAAAQAAAAQALAAQAAAQAVAPTAAQAAAQDVSDAQMVHTVEKIVEVPVIQIEEKIVEVPVRDKEHWEQLQKEMGLGSNGLMLNSIPYTGVEFNTMLAQPADESTFRFHPAAAYLDSDRQQALDFFREHGFFFVPDAVPLDTLGRALGAILRDDVRDNGSQEVLDCLTDKVWDAVRLLLADPIRPSKCQVAKALRSQASEAETELTKRSYFPQDVHIDGLPSMSTDDIMNFSVIVGVPLDPTHEDFMGNYSVIPGSHRMIADACREGGLDQIRTRQWMEPLQRMIGLEPRTTPVLPLRAVPGQVYIAHYSLAHFVLPNLKGADPRRVMYFRVWNRRSDATEESYMRADHSCIIDIWKEFPLIN